MNFTLFIISTIVLVINLFAFIYFMFITPVSLNRSGKPVIYSIFFEYQELAVFSSLLFMNIYVVAVSRAMTNAFAKTQCSEISFYFCFLISCLFESFRLYIPVLLVENTYTEYLIVLGDFSIFARLLAPLSLLSASIMSGAGQRQNLERNMLLIVVTAMFVAMVLPLNTTIIEKDFRVHAGFDKIVVAIEILIDTLAVISLYINNKKEEFSQKTTIGMIMIIAGFVLSINSYNFTLFALSVIFFAFGTVFYLKDLHDRNLYS